jgi:hypothetical protein
MAPRLPGSCTSTATTTSGLSPAKTRSTVWTGRAASATTPLDDRTGLSASMTLSDTLETLRAGACRRSDERAHVGPLLRLRCRRQVLNREARAKRIADEVRAVEQDEIAGVAARGRAVPRHERIAAAGNH